MENYHRLLERQIQSTGFDKENPENKAFLERISKSYDQFERERNILEKNTNTMLESLSASQKKLTNALESMDSFSYHVSHDLKTILINNMNFIRMMDKYSLLGDQVKVDDIKERIRKNSKNGLSLVEKYLVISKTDISNANFDNNESDLTEIVNNVLSLTDLTEKIDLSIKKRDNYLIKAPESCVTSIFQNLLTNSFKYKKKDSPCEVEIKMEETEKGKRITYADNGIGIDLGKHGDKIFQPFVRIQNSANSEGTGIGLYLVKKLMNQLDGTIEIQSEEDKGTTFILNFKE